jgi:hypothetical protein
MIICPYHGYLREVSRVFNPHAGWFGGFKVIYQNGFLGLQDQHILVNFHHLICFFWGLL